MHTKFDTVDTSDTLVYRSTMAAGKQYSPWAVIWICFCKLLCLMIIILARWHNHDSITKTIKSEIQWLCGKHYVYLLYIEFKLIFIQSLANVQVCLTRVSSLCSLSWFDLTKSFRNPLACQSMFACLYCVLVMRSSGPCKLTCILYIATLLLVLWIL